MTAVLSHWPPHHRREDPPNPPKPPVQVPPPVEVMRTVDAATAPVELFEPDAVTQSPTAKSEDEAPWFSSYLVGDEMSTVTGLAVGVVEELEELGRDPKVAEENPSTTMVLAPTEVTLPLAKPKFPDPKGPPFPPEGGRPWPPPGGKDPPFGTEPLGIEPDVRSRPGNPPAVQEPDDDG